MLSFGSSPDLVLDFKLLKTFELGALFVYTLEGWIHMPEGNYLVRGIEGEFYTCNPQIFEKSYEPVPEDGLSIMGGGG